MSLRLRNVLLAVVLGACLVFGLGKLRETPSEKVAQLKVAPSETSKQHRPEPDWWHRRGKWSPSDIQTALARLPEITDAGRKSEALMILLRRWAALDGPAAFAYAQSIKNRELNQTAVKYVAEILARSNPRLLAELLAAHNLDGNRELVHLLAGQWSQTDAQSAFAWAQGLPDSAPKTDALVVIGSQWVSQNPEAAAPQIGRLPNTSAAAGLVSAVGSYWGATDPDEGIAWVNTLPENKQTLALSSLLSAWAQQDPVAAGNYLAQLPAGPLQNELGMAVVASWAKQNPAQAAAWVLQFPAGDQREQDFRVVVHEWNKIDPSGVENWARNLPEGQARDSVLKHLVTTLAYSNPTHAAEMAALINRPVEHQQALESLVLSWSASDPASTRAWLTGLNQTAPLTAHLHSLVP